LPLLGRVFVGRECAGVDETRRILVPDDLEVSRNHLEIRVDPDSSRAVVVDTSSNGTRVNGVRIERAVPVPLSDGDRIQVGSHVVEYHGEDLSARPAPAVPSRATMSVESPITMAMAMGDLINYSTVSEQADQTVLARDVDRLYRRLRELLSAHRGTLIDYVGDAFFASWELDNDPEAVDHALAFVVEASARVQEWVLDLELRYGDGSPLRMGWGVVTGTVVLRLMPGAVVMAIGDAVNLGFRVSALAGRDGRPSVLAIGAVRESSRGPFTFGPPETVTVKGRVGEETIYGVSSPGAG
jgi:class 3 adenylate cyclase